MTEERKGIIQFRGMDMTVIGPDLSVGQKAPSFRALDSEWRSMDPLEESAGAVRVLASVLSLETDVCDRETRQFNQSAAELGDDVHIFVLSTDLPFTQSKWCGAAGVEHVTTLSDHASADFGPKYGVLMKEIRALRRATFVVDREGTLRYVDYLPALGQEPDYDAVLEAVRQAL